MEHKNKFGITESQIKIGVKVDTTDGNDGIVNRLDGGYLFPYLVTFKNGSAWQNITHITKIHE